MDYREKIKKLDETKKKLWKEYVNIDYKSDQVEVVKIPDYDPKKFVYTIKEDGSVAKIAQDNANLVSKRAKRQEHKKIKKEIEVMRKQNFKALLEAKAEKQISKEARKHARKEKARLKALEVIERAEKKAKEAAKKLEQVKKKAKV